MLFIPLSVPISLGVPVVGVGCGGDAPVAATVLMPEATVNEDYLSAGDENEVRLPRKVGGVERIAVAHRMN